VFSLLGKHVIGVGFLFSWPNFCYSVTLTYIYIYTHTESDSGGICTTLGYDGMSDSKQKSSYEHGSDFERLRSYGHF